MPASSVDWVPGIAMLLAGVVIGAIILFRLRQPAERKKPLAAEPAEPAELRDLEVRRDGLIQQLRELEDTAVKRTEEQLAAERYRLELEAANVLRDIDRVTVRAEKAVRAAGSAKQGASPSRSEVHAAEPRRSSAGSFLWGMATMGAVALLIFFVMQSATRRESNAPVTGGSAMQETAPAGPDIGPLLEEVRKNPENLDAHLALANAYLLRQELMQVFKETQFVLDRVPDHPRALSYQALVRLSMGEPLVAESMLKKAIAVDPGLLDARIHLAIVYARMGRMDDARGVMNEAMQSHPQDAAMLQDVLAELERMTAGSTPEGGAAGTASSSSPASAPAGAESIAGVIEVDGTVAARIRPGSVLYLSARPEGVTSGPPLAVKRIAVGAFPLNFRISAADSMMGQALPEKLRLDARVDTDGNAMTREAGAPESIVDGVSLGTSDVHLVLR